jgi:hypothetical protein
LWQDYFTLSIVVWDSGNKELNGLYTTNGTFVEGMPLWTSLPGFQIWYQEEQWCIGRPDAVYFVYSGMSSLPPVNDWWDDGDNDVNVWRAAKDVIPEDPRVYNGTLEPLPQSNFFYEI